jgi:hypothetical protein
MRHPLDGLLEPFLSVYAANLELREIEIDCWVSPLMNNQIGMGTLRAFYVRDAEFASVQGLDSH